MPQSATRDRAAATSLAMNERDPSPGTGVRTHIGHYELLALLGAGGMGEVYRARDLKLERDVALKLLPPGVQADRQRLDRFAQEARAAARLSHPNILAVYELAEEGEVVYLASELLEGRTLRQRLSAGSLPWRKAVDYALQLCAGLAAAHERDIVHCDLKPENLFITGEDRIKILDFGLARLTEERPGEPAPTVTLTLHSDVAIRGTLGYLAPEQARRGDVDQRADLFALGAILYEMLCGRRAFPTSTTAEALGAILKEDPPPLPRTVPRALARVVERCLEKEPAARFRSAHDLGLALDAVAGMSEPSGMGTGDTTRRRPTWRRFVAGAAIAAALALAFAVGLYHAERGAPAASKSARLYTGADLVAAEEKGVERGVGIGAERFLESARRASAVQAPAGGIALWVDDKPDNNAREQELMERLLGLRFHNVVSTSDALAAMAIASGRYRLVISDMSRPDDPRAGYTLLEQMRATGIETPYVIYAGSGRSDQDAEARRLGAEGSTDNPQRLLDLIAAALDGAN